MPITVRISKPLNFAHFADHATDPKILRQITDEIMFELGQLGGQEYVHTYAKRKDAADALAAEQTPVMVAASV